MLKKILTFSLLLILTSCFWGEENSISNSSVQSVFNSDDFTMKIPSKWEVIENTDEILPKPANWEIVFDAVSKVSVDNFYRNILVLKQYYKEDISSLDFTIWNYISSKKEYFYTKLLAEKNVVIDSKKTKIYEFEAKYSENTPILKFLQTGIICDNKSFLITIAIEKSNTNIERYEWLIWSFECSIDKNKSEQ